MNNLTEITTKMQKAADHLQDQLRGLRSGTVSPSLVDTIKVDQYGQQTPIKHVAQTRPVKTGISVEPHDPQMVGIVCNALKEAGFNAYVFSKTAVMVSVPAPSGEEKERVRKRIRELGEEAKIAIRQIRKNAKKDIKEMKETEEFQDWIEKEIQIATDEWIEFVDQTVKDKAANI